MNIVICMDQNYLRGALGLVNSINIHMSKSNIDLYILFESLSNKIIGILRSTFSEINIHFIPIQLPPEIRKIGWLSRMTSGRVLIPKFLSLNRCLYMDLDILCLKSLQDIYTIDLQGKPVAASIDDYDVNDPLTVFKGFWNVSLDEVPETGWPGRPLPKLFSTGLMVMDLEYWREAGFANRYFQWLLQHQNIVRLPNLSASNYLVQGDFVELPWFIHSSILCHGEGAETLNPNDVYTIHYAGEDKPWNSSPPQFERLWKLWWESVYNIKDVFRYIESLGL